MPYPPIWHLLRGQRTLAWAWPDQTLLGQELTDRQAQLPATGAPGQRVALVSECPGEPGRPYCKRLVLKAAQGAKDTGYYRCYYKDVKAIIVGTTAASVYVFVRGESQNPQTSPHTHAQKHSLLTSTHLKMKILNDLLIPPAQHKIFKVFHLFHLMSACGAHRNIELSCSIYDALGFLPCICDFAVFCLFAVWTC